MCLLRAFQSHSIGKQAMMKSKPGSGKRQDRNFEVVVNHITINKDQLPQVSRQSMVAREDVFGHNIKKYSALFTTSQATSMYISLWCLRLLRPRALSKPVLLPPWHPSFAQRLPLWRSSCLAS